jgi:acyl-CoA reductase-like NAD-dependent aldehyde dehydrogenase
MDMTLPPTDIDRLGTIELPRRMLVGGSWVDAEDGGTIEVLDPASGAALCTVPDATPGDIDRAVAAAHAAQPGWAAAGLAERARVLRRIGDLIELRADELARLETLDGGKPIGETRGRVLAAAKWFHFFADVAQRLRSSVVPTEPGFMAYTLNQPVGVVGAIIPWNYPISSCAVKVPAALCMGNTVVLKPAELAPLVPLALGRLAQEAGLPDGVLNVVPGRGARAGSRLVAHPQLGAITFTGSTAVGREIAAVAGRNLTPVFLELGGKSPNIVFPDADLDTAAATSLYSFAQNQGQICTAGSRLLVHRSIRDEFVERLRVAAEALAVGDPLDPATKLGALIDRRQLERVERYVHTAREERATLVTGGRRVEVAHLPGGSYYSPTVFTDVNPGCTIAREEIFGPVLSVLAFDDEEHAIALANETLYGLASAVWTHDLRRAHRMAEAIDAGLVWVNTMHVLGPGLPFGGWKDSGMGVMGGEEQALSFTRQKAVWMNLGSGAPSF